MATTKIVLLAPIENLGTEGETVTVKVGYARNFLIPRKKAILLHRSNRKQIEALIQRREIRRCHEQETAEALAAKILSKTLTFFVKTGETGKLFGAVTAKDLIERLAEEGITVSKKQLHLEAPLKSLGSHKATIKLHADVTAELKVELVARRGE